MGGPRHARGTIATLSIALVSGACLLACGSSTDSSSMRTSNGYASNTTVGALPSGVSSLPSIDPTLTDDALAPLQSIVGNAQVVGLGEAVHTSGGFSQAKSRFVKYMVEKLGFRAITWETPYTAALATQKYLATCSGSVTTALYGLADLWWNTDVEGLLTWLCQYNQAHPSDPVSITGFDMQQPDSDRTALETFLSVATQNQASSLMAGIGTCNSTAVSGQDGAIFTQSDYDDCVKGLTAIDQYLTANEAAIVARSTQETFNLGRITFTGYQAWQTELFYDKTDTVKSFEARDVAMASIFESFRSMYFPTKRTIVWAHNYHLSADHTDVAVTAYPSDAKTMGTVLATDLKADYRPIALIGYQIDISWPGVGEGPEPPAPNGSVEANLHAFGAPYLFVDLSAATGSGFLKSGTTYPVGAPDPETEIPSQQYSALFFLDHSEAMTRIGW